MEKITSKKHKQSDRLSMVSRCSHVSFILGDPFYHVEQGSSIQTYQGWDSAGSRPPPGLGSQLEAFFCTVGRKSLLDLVRLD